VDISPSARFAESETIKAGEEVVVVPTDLVRESYGNSMIIDPWGTIVADAGDAPGLAVAEIDLDRMRDVRRALPMQSLVDPQG
jgi:predicted amidohydrolase